MATKKSTTKKAPAKKKTTATSTRKKSTAKKPAAVSKSKKTTTKTAVNTTRQQTSTKMLFVYAVFAAVVCYGFASWAIDSGNLWFYAAAFAGFYLTVSYSYSLLKNLLQK